MKNTIHFSNIVKHPSKKSGPGLYPFWALLIIAYRARLRVVIRKKLIEISRVVGFCVTDKPEVSRF